MPSNCHNPVKGMLLSCMLFTEPVDIIVVTVLQYAEAAGPNLISFPSIAPVVWLIPSWSKAGFPANSLIMEGINKKNIPIVMTAKIVQANFLLWINQPNAITIAIGSITWAISSSILVR